MPLTGIVDEIEGLTEQEVLERRQQGLGNNAQFQVGRTYLQILRANLFTFINTVLFGISAVLILLGLFGDAAVTAGLVLLNVIIGVTQEVRARITLERIAVLTRPRAMVVRSGIEQSIVPDEIVQGDVIKVSAGDQFFADGQVIGNGKLAVDESLLTGESEPIPKQVGDMVLSGSFCVSGSGYYQAQKVGAENFANRLTAGARTFRQVKTPLQREVDRIIRVLVFLVTLLGILLGIYVSLEGISLAESVRIAAVIVALVPQGLFFMTTVAYTMGAVRVAGRGALIQQANAVESTSHVNLLCLDKTGTLTTNRIHYHDMRLATGTPESEQVKIQGLLADFAANMASDNRTILAIREAFPGAGRPVVEEVLFTSERKWSALRFGDSHTDPSYILGAPEILSKSVHIDEQLHSQSETWARKGLRVLLFASDPDGHPLYDDAGSPLLPGNLVSLGLISFQEELRPEAQDTLQHFHQLGIRLIILSGDHPETVAALARQAGFPAEMQVVSGLELGALSEAQVEKLAEETTVFGRITPQQKEWLIRLFRDKGYYVAMIGDGVNDVLSLKQAQVGIAMQSGSQAARSVADIVLLNDSFMALPIAFREGQRILRGMADVIKLLLTRTFYLLLLIVATQLVGIGFPVTPKHNSLIALLTVGIPILAIAAWARPGQSSPRIIASASHFVFPAALTVASISLLVYLVSLWQGVELPVARSALTLQMIVCGLLLIPFVEPPNAAWAGGDELSGDARPAILSLGMLGVFVLITAIQPLRDFFELSILSPVGYLGIGLLGVMWAYLLRWIWRKRLFERMLEY